MIPVYQTWITDLEKKYVNQALDSGWVGSIGEFIERFEEAFAAWLGVKYAVAVNTGTAACHLALAANGLGTGDEVIIPDTTFIATANAAKYCGCDVATLDISRETWNLDEDKLNAFVGPKTKAVFCMHAYGNMCDMDKLSSVCLRNNLLLIEDACEALGGRWNGRLAGSLSKTAAISFHGGKTITTGEGGMVVTNDSDVAGLARILKGQGQTDRYYHPVVGYNYRMTNVQAAMGLAQLERIPTILAEKQRVFERYERRLGGSVTWQKKHPQSRHAMWVISIAVSNPGDLAEHLRSKQIDSRACFVPLSKMPPYRDARGATNCSNSNWLRSSGIVLPSYPQLTDGQIDMICNKVLEHVEKQ